jgi:hypothetical protein
LKGNSTPKWIGIMVFLVGIDLFVIVFALIIDKIFYVKFLSQNGYGLKDIFVPWDIWVKYHTSGIGLFILIVVALLIIILLLFFLIAPLIREKIIYRITRPPKGDPGQSVFEKSGGNEL